MNSHTKSRFRGLMLGLACGDALGAQVEFMRRGSFPKQTEMTGAGPHKLEPGQWTDDTAMALILAEHLRDDPNLSRPKALATKWIQWWQAGVGSCTGRCFDIGTQTAGSLSTWLREGKQPKHGKGQRGNGALMRVAPVALAHYSERTAGAAAMAARAQALVTHPQECAMLCGDYVALLDVALRYGHTGLKRTLRTNHADIRARPISKVKSGGYDVDTYEAAIWCVARSNSFEDAVVRAVNLGDDADTVGAVTGALAGAAYGANNIPARWLERVAWYERLEAVADHFYGENK